MSFPQCGQPVSIMVMACFILSHISSVKGGQVVSSTRRRRIVEGRIFSANVPSDLSLPAFGTVPAREADQQELCRKSRRDRD